MHWKQKQLVFELDVCAIGTQRLDIVNALKEKILICFNKFQRYIGFPCSVVTAYKGYIEKRKPF